MSLTAPQSQETALVGRIVQSNVEANTLTIKAQFEDRKTGVARTPQSTTRVFTLSKDTERFEIILADSHVTAAGVTTITVNANGRNLNKYGNMVGAATGNKHPINSEIGCAETHIPVEILNEIIRGNEGTNANNFRIGNETDNDITVYAQNADANRPFIRYDAGDSKWYISNDGVNTFDPSAGGSGVAAGNGISIVGGNVNVDTTDNGVFVNASAGVGDAGKVPLLGAGGLLDDTFFSVALSTITATPTEINQALDGISANVTDTNLNTLTGGVASNADALHTHAELGRFTVTTGEAINGSVNALPVSITPTGLDSAFVLSGASADWGDGLTYDNVGELATNYKKAQSFTYTNSLASAITVALVTLPLRKVAAPADNLTVSIFDDNGGEPGSVIANGTSNTVAGAGLSTTDTNLGVATFVFATPPTLTSGTKYWIVLSRSGAADNTNYYTWGRYGNVSAEGSATFTAGPDTWATSTNDYQNYIEFNITGGELVKTSQSDTMRMKHIGWTTSNVADGGSATVQASGVVTTLTGLTAGGGPVASSGTGTYNQTSDKIIFGQAYSATEMLIDKKHIATRLTTFHTNGCTNITMPGTTGSAFTPFLNLGFRPSRLMAAVSCGDGNSNRNDQTYLGGSGHGTVINDLNGAGQVVTAQSTYFYDTGAIGGAGSLAANGFKWSFPTDTGATREYSRPRVIAFGS